ncbi:hypothetical protein TSOC_005279 [Tetrabaena socialis]|uniref:BZIP domain-containing protein n=1 Tax=Tetrabaena socialis TaxID=47790 RepID=A0A2J8A6T8_9CHLO|nr:hypothetical protein TSOC_005279 [Tetrabaena socialis]|eukprot:PNH08203.1 hypothetical protein TSOC_005279 [Tetrabaena socialis]
MEELGSLGSDLGSDLGSLSADLGFFLQTGFVGTGLEQPFSLTGDLDGMAGPLEMPFSEQLEQDIKIEDQHPSTSALHSQNASDVDDDDEEEGRAGSAAGGKRRRRTRTERQQVLNRLAQQRYRQRKKEKVQALQSTVGTLQCQLDRLSFLEAENTQLRATTQRLGEQLGAKDGALTAAQQQLRQACTQLKSVSDKCAGAERQVAEQQAALEAQRQQLRASTLAGVDPQALSDRLLAIVKEALGEVQASPPAAAEAAAAAGGGAPAPRLLLDELLVARISRALTSCCRELVYATKGSAGAGAEAPAAITVSCC